MIIWMLWLSILIASPITPQNSGDESYSESFTAFADLNDGSYVLVQFLFTNAGMGSDKAGCRILHVPKGKKGNNSSAQFSKSEWQASAKRLQVGECYLQKGVKRTVFYGKTDAGSVNLRFDAPIEKKKLHDGTIKVGKKSFYEQDILIMTAKVRAEIAMGSTKKTIEGYAQLDHSRSNALLPDIAKKWVRFRGFRGTTPFFAQLRVSPKGVKKGWVYDHNNNQEFTISSVQLGADPILTFEQGNLVLSPASIIYEYQPLKSYGVLGSLAKAWVGNPTTRTYRGVTTFKGAQIEGLLEIVDIE